MKPYKLSIDSKSDLTVHRLLRYLGKPCSHETTYFYKLRDAKGHRETQRDTKRLMKQRLGFDPPTPWNQILPQVP